ncbi:hypothetical protein [Streptomyces sp. ML-6]|uniref:hypothetical protein n=1 Tax=Streptomyces sp. ML-6 TaxID=2982693 RepID=UPI0024C05B9B|nr:hypothetical protein [Streptomyces sp. ML-6]MDK0519386.1 hypothetical protein [Streptomyces sp. ML-6]
MSALAGAAVAGLAACQPADGLNSASIAVTTDQVGTSALERNGVDVQWLSCTAGIDRGRAGASSPSASARRVAEVDCTGKTGGGKDITLTGRVTQELGGRCVRGDLSAKEGDRSVFRANVLGNCDATSTTGVVNPPPPAGGSGARPTVTVTVTVTEGFRGK